MTDLVLVPGMLLDRRLYAAQIAALPDGIGVHVADTFSDRSIGAMAERLLSAMPDRFAIAGLSMGGMVAMEVLARAPERVLAAALWDTDPTPARDREIAWRRRMRAQVAQQGLATFIDDFAPRFFAHDPEAGRRILPGLRACMLDCHGEVFFAQCDALDARREMRPHLAAARCPVQVLVGSADRICPPSLHLSLKDALPNATYRELHGVGHLPPLEAPERTSRALAELLARI